MNTSASTDHKLPAIQNAENIKTTYKLIFIWDQYQQIVYNYWLWCMKYVIAYFCSAKHKHLGSLIWKLDM